MRDFKPANKQFMGLMHWNNQNNSIYHQFTNITQTTNNNSQTIHTQLNLKLDIKHNKRFLGLNGGNT